VESGAPFYLDPKVMLDGAGVALIGAGAYVVRRLLGRRRPVLVVRAPSPPDDGIKFETVGQLIYIQRRRRGITQAGLAQWVGVTNGTIAAWEADDSTPPPRFRRKLSEALFAGDIGALAQCDRLFARGDLLAKNPDPLDVLRSVACAGALKIESVAQYQGIGGRAGRKRTRLDLGAEVKIVANLDWPARATIVNVALDVTPRSYRCVDAALGLPRTLSSGVNVLPAGARGVTVEEPSGSNCLVLFAWRSELGVPWKASGESSFDVSEREVLRLARRITRLNKDDRLVGITEYEVSPVADGAGPSGAGARP
jgi:DNA-binding XRE family transcriptional regulator